MRFIILAPILCLLAIVAAHPIRQEPAGPLTQHEVTQKIYRRGNIGRVIKKIEADLEPPGDGFNVNWVYDPPTAQSSPEANEAQEKAKKQMKHFVKDNTPDGASVSSISITLSYDPTSGWWSAEATCQFQYEYGIFTPIPTSHTSLGHVHHVKAK